MVFLSAVGRSGAVVSDEMEDGEDTATSLHYVSLLSDFESEIGLNE